MQNPSKKKPQTESNPVHQGLYCGKLLYNSKRFCSTERAALYHHVPDPFAWAQYQASYPERLTTRRHLEVLPFAFVPKNIGKLIWALSLSISVTAMVLAFRRSPPVGVMTSMSGLLMIAACTSSV